MLLFLMISGIISKEDYYNLQAPGWNTARVIKWLSNGKPQSWFTNPPWNNL